MFRLSFNKSSFFVFDKRVTFGSFHLFMNNDNPGIHNYNTFNQTWIFPNTVIFLKLII